MTDKKKVAILIGVFWLIVIFGFIGYKEFTLATGTEIILDTRPVDPRDLFRGDYVILSYQISTVDLNAVVTDVSNFEQGTNVYVALEERDGKGVVTGVYRQQPEGLFLKAKVTRASSNTVRFEYGIESYFVPEGEGRQLERLTRTSDIDVVVKIDKFGNALISEILVDGEKFTF